MSDYDRGPTTVKVEPGTSSGGGLYFLVGALLVAVLVGGYIMLGAPGLHTNVARGPDQKIDVTVQQPAAPAPAAPATPAAPAPRR